MRADAVMACMSMDPAGVAPGTLPLARLLLAHIQFCCDHALHVTLVGTFVHTIDLVLCWAAVFS